jgi:hypothetical protein
MKSIIRELWQGNIMPPKDTRQNTPEMAQLLDCISRHNDDLLKTMTAEQKEIFEKFHDCWSEYASLSDEALFEYVFRLGARLPIAMYSDE